MICYVLAMGKHHLGPHVVVGYGIKIFWPGLFITSPDHLEVNEGMGIQQGRGRRLLKFSYLDHPTKSDVTSGLNWAAQLVSQSEKMAFRF